MDTKDRANWMWLLLILKISRKHLIKFCVTDVLRVQSCNHASNNHKQVESKNSKLFKEKQGARSRKKSSMKETGVATTNLWPCIAHSEIDVQTNTPTYRGTTVQKHQWALHTNLKLKQLGQKTKQTLDSSLLAAKQMMKL